MVDTTGNMLSTDADERQKGPGVTGCNCADIPGVGRVGQQCFACKQTINV